MSMRSIRFYSGLLTARNPAKRALLCTVMSIPTLKHYVGDMVIASEPDPHCKEAVEWLTAQTAASVETACRLIGAFMQSVRTGAPLPSAFGRSYE